MIKVKINNIYAGTKSGMSLFTGEGDAREGIFISFTILSGEGFFYAGQNEGIAIVNREYNFWFPGLTPGQALFVLQTEVSTVNYKVVEKATAYIVDCKEALSVFKGYHGKIAEIRKIEGEVYASVEECKEDIAFFEKVNSWCLAGLLNPVEQHTYSEPESIASGILNLTQHPATPEQVSEGVFEPTDKAEVQALLTFDEIPHHRTIHDRAMALTEIALKHNVCEVMIGGAPYLMSALEIVLENAGIKPLYSFSQRVSQEVVQDDGSIVKTNVFKHIGFVGN